MTNKEILDYHTFFSDCEATTLREYFHELLGTLWNEGEGFSGKRLFGNSGWEYDVYKALVEMGAIVGKLGYDDEGNLCDLLSFDKEAANKLVPHLIEECCNRGSSVNTVEKVFLDTKAIFAEQAAIAVQEALDKIYTEYLPHVESDTQANVYIQTCNWLADFFADRLDKDDYQMSKIHASYSHRSAEAREKIYQEHKEEIIEALGRDFESEIDSLKSQLAAAYRRF